MVHADASTVDPPRKEPRRSSTGRIIALLLIVTLATVLFFFGIANQVRDEDESVVALQALRAEIVTAESSVREYTLFEGSRSLRPYRRAVAATGTALDDARSAMTDDDLSRVDSVERMFREWRLRFAEPMIALSRNDRRQDAKALARSGEGRRQITRIGVLIAAEVADEQEEGKEAQRVERYLGVVAILSIAGLCLALGLAWRTPRAGT